MASTVLRPGRVAVVTGAGSGIGLATSRRLAALGMKVCLSDIAQHDLETARASVADTARGGAEDVLAVRADVASRDDVLALRRAVYGRFGEVALLVNNAVTRVGGGVFASHDDWRRALEVNFWGVVNGVQLFVPDMIAQGTECMVVNVGSKQGITNPPGNAAYNVTKAALKTFTEALQHELRNTARCRVSAHLLVPGWTTTGKREHKPGAWLPDQVVDVMFEGLAHGDFYIICPDDEVTPEMDRKRILWAAGDVTDNRPPLSRWHPDFKQAFEEFVPPA
ncbi:MAG: SDR family NAD(P)-dependent oxidoreductase [Gammaproteobacteria bacterium]|nr:SDR family NAD(P)-dependent oxidoreductase [Gammaproteobacteria bacterium]